MILWHTSDSTYMSIKCSRRITSNIGKGCRHPDEWFMLLALTSAVQPSKNPTKLLKSHTFTNTQLDHATSYHWVAYVAMPTPYPHMHAHTYCTLGLLHTRTHTSTHSIMHPQCLTSQCNMCCTQMHLHIYNYIHISHLCGTLAHKRSTHAHTQNMNTCRCWYMQTLTHKHARTHTHTHTHTNTHTHMHSHARTKMHSHTHMYVHAHT